MPTTPQTGFDSHLYYGITVSGSTTYTEVALCSEIDGPAESTAVVEFGVLGQPYKGKYPGQADAGEVTFTVGYNGQEATHQFLTALLGTRTVLPWKIAYPDGSHATFTGFLSGFEIKGMTPEDPVTADGTITLSGGAAFAPS